MQSIDEPLYQSCYGQVHYETRQGEFRLCFGEMQLWLCPERLRHLNRKVRYLAHSIRAAKGCGSALPFHVCPPGMDGDCFAFYADEIIDLSDLLTGTLTLFDLHQFLHDSGFYPTPEP